MQRCIGLDVEGMRGDRAAAQPWAAKAIALLGGDPGFSVAPRRMRTSPWTITRSVPSGCRSTG